MFDLTSIFIANGAAVVLLVTLLISSRKLLCHHLLDAKIFHTMVIITIIQCIIEASSFVIDGQPNFRVLSLLLNNCLYCNNIFFAFLWTVYADYKLFSDFNRIKKIYRWVMLPALLVILGCIVNLFTPVFFQITESNVYQRTNLYIIPFGLTYLYLAYGVVLIHHYRNVVRKYLFLPALLFMIPIFMGSFLQYLFYGTSLTWLGVSIALTSLYINVQNEVSYIDPLSGLFTRQYMNHYLSAENRHGSSSTMLAGIMMDVDRFKDINDKYGHLMGDDAISTAGSLLLNAVPSKALAVRFAGDEFMVIQPVQSEQEVQETIRRIEESLDAFNTSHSKPYVLRFSIGYSLFRRQDDTIDAFLGRMDAAMYHQKKAKVLSRELSERREQSENKSSEG